MDDKLILSRAAAIQRYLELRPSSSDTLEGIHQTWIRSRGDEVSIEVTRAALDYLLIAGYVESKRAGNQEIWRRSGSAPAPSAS